ncbi:MAG: YfcC family protein [Planctomycetota bacterium]|jgi:uncharacterized ion transporter superfamily protein YfcC
MKLRAPNVFVLIASILLIVGGLTWVIPGGEFSRQAKKTPAGEKQVVVPDSYEATEAVRQSPWDLLKAPIRGFEDGADVIGFILLVGGAFGILNATGAIMALLMWLTRKMKGAGRLIMIPVLMFAFSLGGALFGMAEETIPFVLVTVPLAVALGFDVITGVAIPFVGSQAGFAAAFLNPFTLGIAKGIAEQPMSEGQGYRIFCWVLVTAIIAAFVTWHAWRVSRDPSKSLTADLDAKWRAEIHADEQSTIELKPAHLLTLVAFIFCMGFLAYGALYLDWYITEISGLFLAMSLICGLSGGLKLRAIADAFVQGAKDLAPAAILVAFARGIIIIAQDGKIIDTMLDSMAGTMSGLGPVLGTEAMFCMQTVINFFVPSGSSQAALTMPIMTPLSDLISVPRENAILAYQFGDGFTNMIIPTNPVVIGALAMAKLEYGTWFRWMIKLQILLFILGMTLLATSPFATPT